MSLMSAIPGLSRHQTKPAPVPFDLERACRMIREATTLLAGYYPAGALDWLREMRPEVYGYLKQCEAELDAAVTAEDLDRLRKELDRYVEAHRRAFVIYEEARTPIIEIDTLGGLFQ